MANVVGYKNPASSKANNNFYRERVYTVSNPKTQAQATQRAKVRPAQIFYNAFERVENHAFLPSLRASRNRNRFMSLAMKLNEIPDLLKGEAFIPICNYVISTGALGLDDIAKAANFKTDPGIPGFDWSGAIYFPNLSTDDSIEFESTDSIAVVSRTLIENNAGLVEGMEMTFLAVVASSAEPTQRVAQIVSFVLDKGNSVTKLGDIMGDYLQFRRAAGDHLVLNTETDDYQVLSAGLIISARAGNTYVYTNSKMCKSFRAEEVYSDYEDEVIASYMGGSTSRGSELILQQASNKAPGNRVVPSSVAQVEITLAEGVTGTLSSQNAGVVTMTNGDKRILIANALGQICDYNAAAGTAVPVTITPEGGTARPLTLADTTFAGNGTITVADVQVAGISLNLASSAFASVTSVEAHGAEVAQGDVKNIGAGDSITIGGEGLNTSNCRLFNASRGQDMEPIRQSEEEFAFTTYDAASELYQLYINGSLWANFVTE